MVQYGSSKIDRKALSMTFRDTFDDVTLDAAQLLNFFKVEQVDTVCRVS